MNEKDADEMNRGEMIQTVRTRHDKLLKFDGQDRDGDRVTWFVGYLGKYGWSACRGTGDWTDDPDEKQIHAAFGVYDNAEVVNRSEVAEQVEIGTHNPET